VPVPASSGARVLAPYRCFGESDERALGDVTDDDHKSVKQIAFPFRAPCQVLGEYKEQRAPCVNIQLHGGAAALMFLLTQGGGPQLGAHRLSLLACRSLYWGGLAAIAITDGTFSLGSLLGLGAVLALMVRQGVGLVAHFQHLPMNEGEPFRKRLVRRGVQEQFPTSSHHRSRRRSGIPFAIMGDVAGLELRTRSRSWSWAASLP